jgi:hypothetical protein
MPLVAELVVEILQVVVVLEVMVLGLAVAVEVRMV